MSDAKGYHIIVDCCQCECTKLDSVRFIENLLNACVQRARMEKIGMLVKEISGCITGYCVIATSHIGIVSSAEKRTVLFDIYSCGPKKGAVVAAKYMISELQPKIFKEQIIVRG